jgi:hypothetical protein
MSIQLSPFKRFNLVCLFGLALSVIPLSEIAAQPRGGVVRSRIVNGTTGGAGQAEWATLLNLSSGMDEVTSVPDVSGSFTLEGFEVQAEAPYLLQVISGGVSYNQRIDFGRGYEAEATVTVYDTTSDWEGIEIKTARFLLRREHDRLRIDKLYVVENNTEPKKTLYDPAGSFRFYMPTDVVEMRSISASHAGGMSVPQSASPLNDGSGFSTRTAFKPGTTDFAVSYDVDYSSNRYRLVEQAFHQLDEVMVLVAPPDIDLEAPGWENLGREPDGRFVVLRQLSMAPGSPIELSLSGGSEHAADLVPSSSAGGGGSVPEGHPSTRVTRLPDQTRAQKWIVVLLMGAALAYGLLTALVPAQESKPDNQEKTSDKSHRTKKRNQQARAKRASGSKKH